MRILHTSDWHLGRSLEGRSRQAEHEAFIDEFCDLADQEQANLILIAGDVFDSVNPPGWAEQLLCDALDRLADGGRRAVAVIAGNHDSPERLTAVQPLAGRFGIFLLGLPGDDLSTTRQNRGPGAKKARSSQRVALLKAGPSWLEIGLPGCGQSAVIAALPYPSEARLNQLLSRTLEEESLQAAYSDQIGRILAELSRNFRPDAVNLAVSHLYLTGGLETSSERPIQVGTAYAVSPAAVPAAAQYLALGHLHRPQGVGAAPVLTRYSGSPLAFDFGEAGQAKSVVLLDIEPGLGGAGSAAPGQAPKYELIPVSSGKPLIRWEAKEGLEQVMSWCREGRDQNAWIDLTVSGGEPLSSSQVYEIRTAHPGIVNIRMQPDQADGPETAAPSISSLTWDEQFRAFYRKRNSGQDPSAEVVRLFLELTQAGDEDQTGDQYQAGDDYPGGDDPGPGGEPEEAAS